MKHCPAAQTMSAVRVESQVARQLRTVLARLEDQRLAGWCRRVPKNLLGQECLEEALRTVCHRLDGPAAQLIRRVIRTPDIWVWNDEWGRTFADVRAAILEAIDLAQRELPPGGS